LEFSYGLDFFLVVPYAHNCLLLVYLDWSAISQIFRIHLNTQIKHH
jgi:hypothetical protein